jgi:hypothetical protein
MQEIGSTGGPADDERMSIGEIHSLEAWLDGDEPLTAKDAKRLLDKGVKTGALGRNFHYVHLGIAAHTAGPKAWPKMGFKVLK